MILLIVSIFILVITFTMFFPFKNKLETIINSIDVKILIINDRISTINDRIEKLKDLTKQITWRIDEEQELLSKISDTKQSIKDLNTVVGLMGVEVEKRFVEETENYA